MSPISRRESLKTILFGAVAAGVTVSAWPTVVEAAPVAVDRDLAAKAADELLKQDVQWGPERRRHRRYHRRHRRYHRRRRRWVCYWRRGRRVCRWRYW